MSAAGVVAIAVGLALWVVDPTLVWGPYVILAGLTAYGAAAVDTYLHTRYPSEEEL